MKKFGVVFLIVGAAWGALSYALFAAFKIWQLSRTMEREKAQDLDPIEPEISQDITISDPDDEDHVNDELDQYLNYQNEQKKEAGKSAGISPAITPGENESGGEETDRDEKR